jgi:hypothetical protein
MVFLVVRLGISALLLGLGLGIATNYRDLAHRSANFMAGETLLDFDRPSYQTDRYWSVLPLALGLSEPFGIILDHVDPIAAATVGIVPILVYFAANMRLGWLYTPPSRRVIGPVFWTRRAAALPAVAFLLCGGLLALVYVLPGFR